MWSLEKLKEQYAVIHNKQVVLLLGESHGEGSEEYQFWQKYCREKNQEASESKH